MCINHGRGWAWEQRRGQPELLHEYQDLLGAAVQDFFVKGRALDASIEASDLPSTGQQNLLQLRTLR